VNQTRPHCVNQMGKTHSKPLAARHGRGTAWARHAMCESALRELRKNIPVFQSGGWAMKYQVGIAGWIPQRRLLQRSRKMNKECEYLEATDVK